MLSLVVNGVLEEMMKKVEKDKIEETRKFIQLKHLDIAS